MGLRYRRLVPAAQRALIRRLRLPKPNWFVGSAERPMEATDPAIRAQVEELKRELRAKREEAQGG